MDSKDIIVKVTRRNKKIHCRSSLDAADLLGGKDPIGMTILRQEKQLMLSDATS